MTKLVSSMFKIVLVAFIPIFSFQGFAQSKNEKMKIMPPTLAPTFIIKDVLGATVNLDDYKEKKVMLTFYRNVGCPICNLRFHELQEQSDYFKQKGLVLLAVYESTSNNMKQYVENENFYAIMIPNPDLSLYERYGIEQSDGKLMKGMFHGALSKMSKGKTLFKNKIKQDGNSNRISADFLIDEAGNIQTAYYGKFVGDHLPMAYIKRFLN